MCPVLLVCVRWREGRSCIPESLSMKYEPACAYTRGRLYSREWEEGLTGCRRMQSAGFEKRLFGTEQTVQTPGQDGR